MNFFLLVREDDDASGPSILLRAAAEMIVDEAERHRHIDAAEALLGLIPTVDLETSVTILCARRRQRRRGHGGRGLNVLRETAVTARVRPLVRPQCSPSESEFCDGC